MSQSSEYLPVSEGQDDSPDPAIIAEVVRDHLAALYAELAAHPEPPRRGPSGRPQLGPPPLPDDRRELYARVCDVLRQQGHRVISFDETTYQGRVYLFLGYGGLVDEYGDVWVKGAESRNMLLTLLHEYVHVLRHDSDSVGEQECAPEAVSYVVGGYFGVHHPTAARYLSYVSGSDELAVRNVAEQAEDITLMATQMIMTILGQVGG
jgi:hypothetical protein